MSLRIDYEAVESKLAKIKSTVSSSNLVADYSALISGFSESEGKQAEAIKEALEAEKSLAEQLNQTLTKFAEGIQGTVNEFKSLDANTTKEMRNKW